MLIVPDSVTGDVPDSQKITMFAPVNSAYQNKAKRYNDFSQDDATRRSVSIRLNSLYWHDVYYEQYRSIVESRDNLANMSFGKSLTVDSVL
jgi:proline dehydrogenase